MERHSERVRFGFVILRAYNVPVWILDCMEPMRAHSRLKIAAYFEPPLSDYQVSLRVKNLIKENIKIEMTMRNKDNTSASWFSPSSTAL